MLIDLPTVLSTVGLAFGVAALLLAVRAKRPPEEFHRRLQSLEISCAEMTDAFRKWAARDRVAAARARKAELATDEEPPAVLAGGASRADIKQQLRRKFFGGVVREPQTPGT